MVKKCKSYRANLAIQKNVPCFQCAGIGHFVVKCPKKSEQIKSQSTNEVPPVQDERGHMDTKIPMLNSGKEQH